MFGYFIKRPVCGLFLFIALWVTGGVFAHQSRQQQPEKKEQSLSLVKSRRLAQLSWKKKLSISKAHKKGAHLVQNLSKGIQVTYTIDPDLQEWAESYLASYKLPYAGMVMMDVKTGRILVMAGHSSRNEKVSIEELCLSPWAPAASVFKLVTASALLAQGVSEKATVCYHGGARGIAKHHLKNNAKLDTACKTLSYAIAKSVNPIMGKLAVAHLNKDILEQWSYRFGFNRPIPFELPVQPSQATIPSTELELAQVAAGFWKTEASVLHGALIAEIAATRGVLRWPRVVESVKDRTGKHLELPAPAKSERILSRPKAKALARMMVGTTTFGTARKSFISRRGRAVLPGFEVAGKTGSLSRNNPYLHYNWFVGFAPVKQPEVAFAVLLGNPARWHIKAHTAARALLGQYLTATEQSDKPKLETEKQKTVTHRHGSKKKPPTT